MVQDMRQLNTKLKYLFLLLFLTSCFAKQNCATPTINYSRLESIEVNCSKNTYGECILKYDNALKKSNDDKKAILEYIK